MTPTEGLTLLGFINPVGIFPSFVIPVFHCNGELYIQDGGEADRIERFVVWKNMLDSPVDYSRNRAPFGSVVMLVDTKAEIVQARVGDGVIRGFATNKRMVFYGDRNALGHKLSEKLNLSKVNPFVAAEVADFLHDRTAFEEAIRRASKLIAKDSSMIAGIWQDAMLFENRGQARADDNLQSDNRGQGKADDNLQSEGWYNQ